MSSLTEYRARVPAHDGVDDTLIEQALEDAVARHSAAAFGDNYVQAMIWWAAHRIELTPGSGAPGQGCPGTGVCTTGPVGSRSARKAAAACKASPPPPGGTLTVYWQWYQDILRTRAVRAPRHVTVAV